MRRGFAPEDLGEPDGRRSEGEWPSEAGRMIRLALLIPPAAAAFAAMSAQART